MPDQIPRCSDPTTWRPAWPPPAAFLTWDDPLPPDHEPLALARMKPWFGDLDHCVTRHFPPWLGEARAAGDAPFHRAMALWFAFQGIGRDAPVLFLESARRPLLSSATLHALGVVTGRAPVSAVHWVSLRRRGRIGIAPVLRGHLGLGGLDSGRGSEVARHGAIALLHQAAVELDLPAADRDAHESALRVLVPAVHAWFGRCLVADLLTVLDPPQRVLQLVAALHPCHPERDALRRWVLPAGSAGTAAEVMPPLDLRLAEQLSALALLLRACRLG